jgi:hypothetical protein
MSGKVEREENIGYGTTLLDGTMKKQTWRFSCWRSLKTRDPDLSMHIFELPGGTKLMEPGVLDW